MKPSELTYHDQFSALIKLQEANEGPGRSSKANAAKKSLVDEIMADMGNIDYCLEYYTKLAESNTEKKVTEIDCNKRLKADRSLSKGGQKTMTIEENPASEDESDGSQKKGDSSPDSMKTDSDFGDFEQDMKAINDEGDLDHPAGFVEQDPPAERRPAVRHKTGN